MNDINQNDDQTPAESTSEANGSGETGIDDVTDVPPGTGAFQFRRFMLGELPLQNSTSIFIFVNTLDIFMTYILIRFGAIEANPVANLFMDRWGFVGLIAFKLFIVTLVCVIAQVVALKKPGTARGLLVVGSVFVAIVVVYSALLFIRHFL